MSSNESDAPALKFADALAAELDASPPIRFDCDAAAAYLLAALLQLACRHPQVNDHSRAFAREFVAQLKAIGPVTAAILEMGWD
jgi:hypothetical protein